MSHPFGDLLSQHLHRKHGLSQSKLAAGILQDPAVIGKMCKGQRLTGPQARERVLAIVRWLREQAALETIAEANAMLEAAGMGSLRTGEPVEAALLQQLGTAAGRKQASDDRGIQSEKAAGAKLIEQSTPPLDLVPLSATTDGLAQLPTDRVPPVAPLPTGSRMPFGVNPLFVGRATDLLTLAAALKGGETVAIGQIAAATGLGGIGKTQLAVAFVHHYGRFFAGGIQWLNFADPSAVPAEVAACGAVLPELRNGFTTLDLETQVRQVQAVWQGPQQRLLVFDNCEEPALLAQWRPTTGGSHILVTSRRQRWDATLGVQILALDTLTRPQSIELLRKFRPDLATTDPQLDQIAAEVGDLPLALHLAGSYLAHYRQVISPTRYLAQLQQPNRLQHRSLQTGDLSPTGHVQHVARTFALSYEQLNPVNPLDALAQALLARVAWFAPGQLIPRPLLLATISLGDGEESALQAADALEQLANLGLLTMTAAGDIVVHRLVVQFVQHGDATLNQAAQNAVATALLTEADRINDVGIPKPLLAWQNHLRAITDAVKNQDNEQAARLCNALGTHLYQIGVYAAARTYHERALAIRLKVLGEKHPNTALSFSNLGEQLHALEDLAAARPYLERALAIRQEVLGEKHPHTAMSFRYLGALLHSLWELASARPYLERALAINEEVLGAKHPDTAMSLCYLGSLFYSMRQLTTARAYFERALMIHQEVLGDQHPDTARSLSYLGSVLHAMGQLTMAHTYHERALLIRQEVLGEQHPDTALSLNDIGEVLYAQGNLVTARSYYMRALAMIKEQFGSSHPYAKAIIDNLANLG